MNASSDKSPSAAAVGDAILSLLAQRDPAASICPSEVARGLTGESGDWRALMPAVRRAAARLAERGAIQVTQGERVVDAINAVGPIRLRRPAG